MKIPKLELTGMENPTFGNLLAAIAEQAGTPNVEDRLAALVLGDLLERIRAKVTHTDTQRYTLKRSELFALRHVFVSPELNQEPFVGKILGQIDQYVVSEGGRLEAVYYDKVMNQKKLTDARNEIPADL